MTVHYLLYGISLLGDSKYEGHAWQLCLPPVGFGCHLFFTADGYG